MPFAMARDDIADSLKAKMDALRTRLSSLELDVKTTGAQTKGGGGGRKKELM